MSDNFITVEFQVNGQKFSVDNVHSVFWQVHRPQAQNGCLGMRGHEIGVISFTRSKSLQVEGVAKLEDDTIKLAAATEQKAYFDGQVTIARADDSTNILQTIRWKGGHICELSNQFSGGDFVERFEVSVRDLEVNDSTFRRNVTN